MRKRTKRLLVWIIMFITMVIQMERNVLAANYEQGHMAETKKHMLEYDLQLKGIQEYKGVDEYGRQIVIRIEEIEGKSKVESGTYKVSYKLSGCWNAGFYIDVSNNCIIAAYDKFFTTYSGAILSSYIKLENTKQASLYMAYKSVTITYSTGVRAIISGNTLSVSVI